MAEPKRWRIKNASVKDGTLTIAGWDFGGEGPLAFLHHANGMCAATWAQVAVALTANYHVLAMDARGHGDSDHLSVPDDYDWSYYVSDLIEVVGQVLDETGETTVALGIGSSFGGIITAAAQAEHGHLFERIVMLDPPIHPTKESAAAAGYKMSSDTSNNRGQLVKQTLRRRAVWESRDEARQAWQSKPLFAAWDTEAFDLYLAQGLGDTSDGRVALKCDPTVEAHIFATTGSLDVMNYAPRVNVPVHLVHAEHGFFAGEFFSGIAGLFPNAEFFQISAGHMLPLEVPGQVAEFLLDLPG